MQHTLLRKLALVSFESGSAKKKPKDEKRTDKNHNKKGTTSEQTQSQGIN